MLRFLFIIFCIVLFVGCSKKSDSGLASTIKFKQYYAQGQLLYKKHCSNCHQTDGSGLGLLYPPLNTSDYMDQHFEQVLCLMKYGIKGEIIINNKSYNKEMPGVISLTELEVTEIATYIYNTWSHSRDSINLTEVRGVLQNCK